MEAAATADAPSAEPSTSSLDAFLSECGLSSVSAKLSGDTLESLVQIHYGLDIYGTAGPEHADPQKAGRKALLEHLQQLGLNLKERQTLANNIAKASRDGRAGFAETAEEIANRVAWLDGGEPSTEPPWPPSSRPFLVFTSAGDANNVPKWLVPEHEREWDLVVAYYGESEVEPPCMQVADHSLRMKGGKFPNLLRAMRQQYAYFASFEAILVADDDLDSIGADSITRLFQLRRQHDLWLLQPANHPMAGKADFRELRSIGGSNELRFVNFIEVTAPLIRTDKLIGFLKEYIPRRHENRLLVGYGIDGWLCQWLLGIADAKSGDALHKDKAAVVDSITFINPTNEEKKNGREIDRLQEFGKRVDEWQTICKKRGLSENVTFRVFGGIEKDGQRVEEYVWKLKSEVELS